MPRSEKLQPRVTTRPPPDVRVDAHKLSMALRRDRLIILQAHVAAEVGVDVDCDQNPKPSRASFENVHDPGNRAFMYGRYYRAYSKWLCDEIVRLEALLDEHRRAKTEFAPEDWARLSDMLSS